MRIISRRAVLAGMGTYAILPQRGSTQDRTLKIIYPFSAGGAGDAVARLVAEQLQKRLARPVVVDNRIGAGGRIGALAVKDAPSDGTVLLFAAASQLTLQPHISTNLGYDPFADLAPVIQAVEFDQALAVASSIPVHSVAELADWLRANPDKATFGSPGVGTIPYFAGVEFGRLAHVDLRHVAYRGTSAAMPDLLTGRISTYIASTAELLEQHKSGGIRVLAVAGAHRSEFLPDVPTLKESGIDIDAPGWFAFYAPARTPDAEIARLATEIAGALATGDVKSKIVALGFTVTALLAPALSALQRQQHDQWGKIVKASGYKAQ
jgi:tripartite-type tricarboxylate transporter receptor subunit TctC